MKLLFDTSALVAGLIKTHPAHLQVLPYLQKVKSGIHQGVVTKHLLAELYSVLTTLPVKPRINPSLAYQLIDLNIVQLFEIVDLSIQDYLSLLKHLVDADLKGGIVYDAIILTTAKKVEVDQIITLNKKDFVRIFPDLSSKIISPMEIHD